MYNKLIFLSLLSLLFISPLSAQETTTEAKSFIKFGYGYYMDMFMAFDDLKPDPYTGLTPENIPTGTALWIEGGYKLHNGIIVSASIMYATVKDKYTDLLYQGKEYIDTHVNYVANFSYGLNISGRHKFVPGFGFLINSWTTSRADYFIGTDNDGNLVISNFYIVDGADYELGINLNLDYYYLFENNFFIGARVNTVYLVSVSSLESMVFSPILGVKF